MVFFVLIFSLVQGAFAIMLYTARTQWVAAYNDQSKELQVARANADQFAVEVKKAQADGDAKANQKEIQIKKLQTDAVAMQNELRNLEAKDLKQRQVAGDVNATVMAIQAENQRRQADVDQYRKTLAAQMDENKKLVDANNELRTAKITADIENNALREGNKQMMGKLEELAKDEARRRFSVAGGPAGKLSAGRNPPLENIEGLVKTFQGNLVKITIGSDATLRGQESTA
jgi:hypothetical protein